jgi:Zn-dependent metalloprotease
MQVITPFLRRIIMVLSIFLFVHEVLLAQPSLIKMKYRLNAKNKQLPNAPLMEIVDKKPSQASIMFSENDSVRNADLENWLSENLELRKNIDRFERKQNQLVYKNFILEKQQQYYKGIKVEHGIINSVSINGRIRKLQFEFYSIDEEISTKPVIDEQSALQKAVEYIGAIKYTWETLSGINKLAEKPKGELVFIESMNFPEDGICLAYRFDIEASNPISRTYVYVNATNGKIALTDAKLKSSNTPASADTKYSGRRSIVTYSLGNNNYHLYEESRGADEESNVTIHTVDVQLQPNNTYTNYFNTGTLWTTPQYGSNNNAALDAHWGAEVVTDYWLKVHGRKGFGDNNEKIINIIDANLEDNAVFISEPENNSGYMTYGFSSADYGKKPLSSIDICAHEISHGVSTTTANFVYARESGALDEGFSDIWGACVSDYANKTYPLPANKDIWKIGEEVWGPASGLTRSMQNPESLGQAAVYLKGANWIDASLEGCRKPEPSVKVNDVIIGNDFCGIHTNSGVLNRWFYIIAEGGTIIEKFGIDSAATLAYVTELFLTPNSGYQTARLASLDAARVLSWNSNCSDRIKEAWKAVGVFADSIFTMSNSPEFLTNLFTSIGVGMGGYVWAGTARQGLYRYDGYNWKRATQLTNNFIAEIKSDTSGGIWIAQYGANGAQATGGGINYYRDSTFGSYIIYTNVVGNNAGIPNKNVRSIYVDNYLNAAQPTRRIWSAHIPDLVNSVSRTGAVGRGLSAISNPYFTSITAGVRTTNNLGTCERVAGNKDEVWVFASANTVEGYSQILRYDAKTDLFKGYYDITNTSPALSANFSAKAMYFDSVGKRWWIGLHTGGLYLYDVNFVPLPSPWRAINFPGIFPAGTIVNHNAITGDAKGNIYIGTSNGLVAYFNQNGASVDNPSSYNVFTTTDGLPSNNVNGIGVDPDSTTGRIFVATSSGIALKYNLRKPTVSIRKLYSTKGSGNWYDASVWSEGNIPTATSDVEIRHQIVVNANVTANSIKVTSPGAVTVSPGVELKVARQ